MSSIFHALLHRFSLLEKDEHPCPLGQAQSSKKERSESCRTGAEVTSSEALGTGGSVRVAVQPPPTVAASKGTGSGNTCPTGAGGPRAPRQRWPLPAHTYHETKATRTEAPPSLLFLISSNAVMGRHQVSGQGFRRGNRGSDPRHQLFSKPVAGTVLSLLGTFTPSASQDRQVPPWALQVWNSTFFLPKRAADCPWGQTAPTLHFKAGGT